MTYRIRKADLTNDDDLDHLRDIHILTFDNDAPMPAFGTEYEDAAWWLVYDRNLPEHPMGFAGVCKSTAHPKAAYFWRVGVLPEYAGLGLGRRLLRTAERHARAAGYSWMISDTKDAVRSANNFIKSGYLMFEPEEPWSFAGACYFRKKL